LPIPGGALFSAPMVASAAGEASVPPGKLSAINYWFRHIWEHWWPVYPGVILAMTLTGRSFGDFALVQMPLGLGMVLCGLLIFRNTHPDLHARVAALPPGTLRNLLKTTASIWIIIVIAVPATLALRWVPGAALPARLNEFVTKFLPVGLGLAAAVAWTLRLNRLGFGQSVRLCLNKTVGSMLALVLSVMVFQYVLTRVNAADQIARELQALHVPVLLVVVILPFIAGAVTGLAVNTALRGTNAKTRLDLLANTLFVPAFFVSMGMIIRVPDVWRAICGMPLLVVGINVALIGAKFLAAWCSKLLFRYTWPAALTIWSLSMPQVAATLAAAMVAYQTINARGQRLIDNDVLNAVLVLMLVTSLLGPLLTGVFAKKVAAEMKLDTCNAKRARRASASATERNSRDDQHDADSHHGQAHAQRPLAGIATQGAAGGKQHND
jgi:hypothetical protein